MDRQVLYERSIGSLLPRLAEDIALSTGEVGFKVIPQGNTEGTGLDDRNLKATGFQRCARASGYVVKPARLASDRALPRTSRRQWQNWVGYSVEGAVVDAADSPRIIDHAVRLTALNDCDAMNCPAICDFT